MIPFLIIIGATFFGTLTVKGVANAISSRKSSSPKTTSKKTTTEEPKELDKSLDEEVEKKIENPERNADHVEDAERMDLIENLKEFVKAIQSVLDNKDVTSIAKEKIDSSLKVGYSRIDDNNKELLAYVESSIKNKWNKEVSKATDEANKLIDELNNGESVEDVISKFPSVPTFEDFVDELENKEHFVFDAKRKFLLYYYVRDFADDIISRFEKDDPRIKQINDICDSLKKERDNIDVTSSKFVDLQSSAREKIDNLFKGEELDEEIDEEEVEENNDLEETEFERTKELLNQAKEQLKSNKTNKGFSIDELIDVKLERMSAEGKINPDVKENRRLIKEALKQNWSIISRACQTRIDGLIADLDDAEDYDSVLDAVPTVTLETWIESKACDAVIDRTSQKFVAYAGVVKEANEQLAAFKNIKDNNVVESKTSIVNYLKSLEGEVISPAVSVENFTVSSVPKAKIHITDRINSMSRDSHFTDIMSDVAKLKKGQEEQRKEFDDLRIEMDKRIKGLAKSTSERLAKINKNKADKTDVDELKKSINDLTSIVEEHSYDLKMIGNLELADLIKTVNLLKDNQDKLGVEFDKKLVELETNLHTEMDKRIKGLAKSTSERLARINKNKADKTDVDELKKSINDLSSIVEEHSYDLKMLGALGLADMLETVTAIKENQSKLGIELDEKIDNLEKSLKKELYTAVVTLGNSIEKELINLKETKASSKSVDELKKSINDLSSIVEEHSYDLKMLGALGLADMLETVTAIKENQSKLGIELDEKIDNLEKSLKKELYTAVVTLGDSIEKELINLKATKASSKSVASLNKSIKELTDTVNKHSKSLEGIELMNLSQLLASVEELENKFNDVRGEVKDIVSEELEIAKAQLKKSIAISIGKRISNKLKDFDPQIQEKVAAEVKKQLKNSIDNLDDEQVDKVIDKIVDKIKIVKK